MQDRLSHWFISPGDELRLNDQQYQRVYSVFRKVRYAMDNRTLNFENDFADHDGERAWVLPLWFGLSSDIHLRPIFYRESARRQVGILFHELTHLYAGTGDAGYFDSGSLGNVARPTYNDRQRLTTGQLIGNADTYEGFLEDYFLADVPDR